jgi:predicted CDP-diglyceride synthetase/phosphatidate cytidylyltransferase
MGKPSRIAKAKSFSKKTLDSRDVQKGHVFDILDIFLIYIVGSSEFEPVKHYPRCMSKVSIIHYLVHVNLLELFIYLIPVLSLLALMKANGHLNRFLITLDKNKKQPKKKVNLAWMVNILILASIIGYMFKREFPQKEYFYKSSISKKQIKNDRENFLIGEK